jgi:hypothetical protein
MSDLDLGARDSAESRNGLSVQPAFSVADMDYFKPPTSRMESTSTQVAMGQDKWADYEKQTLAGLSHFENGQIGQFTFTYLNGNEKVQAELKTAFNTAGINLESDGTNVKLSLKDDPSKAISLGPDGINPPDHALIRKMISNIKNRPEVRSA